MLQPLRSTGRGRNTAIARDVPPPITGLNGKDDLSAMKATDAIQLDNLVVTEGGVVTRDGFEAWATGLGAAVETLMEYSTPGGTKTLFAAASTAIWNATASGAASSSVTGLTNARWSHTMFATSGGTFLFCVNGADSARYWNGTTWTVPTITGVTSSTLISVISHLSRLWFVETGSMKAWYLPTLSVAGAATSIDFGGLSKLGGELWAIATWTRDGGDGVDDLTVFITSKGECHVYAGSDPASALTWSRVGTFRIAEPIGRRCVVKTGADAGILTTQGLLPLSAILPLSQAGQARVAATDRIGKLFGEASLLHRSKFGWQVIESPKYRQMLINVPLAEGVEQVQYVMSTATGAWSKFTGMNGASWGHLGEDLFFGGNDGTVYKIAGNKDNGDPIESRYVSAFMNFGTSRTKVFKRIRPQFFGPYGVRPGVGLRLDYEETGVASSSPGFESAGTAWDDGTWDEFTWGEGAVSNAQWQGVRGEGRVAAVIVNITSEEQIRYNGAKVLCEIGDEL